MAHDQLKAIMTLPFQVLVTIPVLIFLIWGWNIFRWTVSMLEFILVSIAGIVLMIAGLYLVVITIQLFTRRGSGTLVPWKPPTIFIAEGIYKYQRNPMITGVLLVLLGEAISFQSQGILIEFGIFLVLNLTYMPLKEEPDLRKRFGDSYVEYTKHVPRWIPRRKPWIPDEAGDAASS